MKRITILIFTFIAGIVFLAEVFSKSSLSAKHKVSSDYAEQDSVSADSSAESLQVVLYR
ncbi:MAG: hypothetical protein JXA77_18100 [Bacteroidales bacterium]|nr:hypothetical protein [Bacteroidales bacterium]MBN2818097.1 hypothetical protein [Bacteroidales bacterium]